MHSRFISHLCPKRRIKRRALKNVFHGPAALFKRQLESELHGRLLRVVDGELLCDGLARRGERLARRRLDMELHGLDRRVGIMVVQRIG